MMQKITMRDEFSVQDHHDPLILEKEEGASPKHLPTNPSYHIPENGFIDKSEEKQSANLMCMFDDITFDDFPNFDKYDDDYFIQIEANLTDQSTAGLWEEEVQFQQLEYSDQPMHISYGSEEESEKNLEVSEGSLPLCFTSFQFIRDNFDAIKNQQSLSFNLDNQEDNEILDQSSLPLCFSSLAKKGKTISKHISEWSTL